MYKLVFFVPESHLEIVKEKLFTAGAGEYKNYSQCCWQVLGKGQFKPLSSSSPYIGVQNSLLEILEYRVEMICDDKSIKKVINELKLVHPYESPAYEAYKLKYYGD